MKRFVSIEGVIGSGKTTLLEQIERAMPHVRCEKEPLGQWLDVVEPVSQLNMFQLMYRYPAAHGFEFQVLALTTLHERDRESPGVVERSMLTSNKVFTTMMGRAGTLSSTECQVYDKLYSAMTLQHKQAIIYLRTDPLICLERVRERDRDGEETISLDYLTKCHDQHEELIASLDQEHVLIVDANQPLSELQLYKINRFIERYTPEETSI